MHGTNTLAQAQTIQAAMTYLENDTVLNEHFVDEQPCPYCAVTDDAALGVDGVNGCLASVLFPYSCQCLTAATGVPTRGHNLQLHRDG